MQSMSATRELDIAIRSIETLLNSNGGEFVIEAIKTYKEQKTLDQNTMFRMQQGLSV